VTVNSVDPKQNGINVGKNCTGRKQKLDLFNSPENAESATKLPEDYGIGV